MGCAYKTTGPIDATFFTSGVLQAMIGNGHAVGVAAQITQHLHGTAKGRLSIDDPVLAVQAAKQLRERLGISERGG